MFSMLKKINVSNGTYLFLFLENPSQKEFVYRTTELLEFDSLLKHKFISSDNQINL